MKKIVTLVLLCIIANAGFGQINPLGSMYYQNPYVLNPAMGGIEEGWELNGALKAQWTAIDGAPLMQSITATYGSERKTGFGMSFFKDAAGVISRTSFKASYAYHLPLNRNGSFLDFGLAGGVLDEYLDLQRVRGDLGDLSLSNYNTRGLYFDADFGVAFRTDRITLQGVLPNLKRFLGRDQIRNIADRALYMVGGRYKFINEGAVIHVIEPMVMYRSVENYKDIIDAGANFQFFEDKLMLSGIYHSTNSVTFGAGTVYKNRLSILTQYTTNTSDLQGYSNGEFEISLKYNFR
ncbi:PorP/SprF family type IX secretion system membrane protein [Pedobacter sp. MW01-1-1]|uniref:PorP/SprF family type IX secretion system membrane protein n=1 Tax=Pedobacter sp. MW01-1-1 TaxID=3383027 RepID=UPI003FEF6B1E